MNADIFVMRVNFTQALDEGVPKDSKGKQLSAGRTMMVFLNADFI